MEEKAILSLISLAVRQVLQENGAGWNESDETRIAEQIADIAWTALVAGARESLAHGGPVVLEEFGRFEVVRGKWHFDAAESLQEARALSLPAGRGHQFVAAQTLYFLTRAAELARRVPADTQIHRDDETNEERLRAQLFGEPEIKKKFGDLVREKMKTLTKALGEKEKDILKFDVDEFEIVEVKNLSHSIGEVNVRVIGSSDIVAGAEYEGTVKSITDREANVEIKPGEFGTLHFSQISNASEGRIGDHLKIGDRIKVKVTRAHGGVISLSLDSTPSASTQRRPLDAG